MNFAFADSGDCWFIFCIFQSWFSPKESTPDKINEQTGRDRNTGRDASEIQTASPEEQYVIMAEKGRERGVQAVKDKIDDFKESRRDLIKYQKELGIKDPYLINKAEDQINFYQNLVDEYEDQKNNPEKYYTQETLVKKALEYYKIKPNGTSCDEDRRWLEDRNACVRTERAASEFSKWDLEWLRYYSFDNYK